MRRDVDADDRPKPELLDTKAGSPPASDADVPLMRLALQGWSSYLRTYRGPVAAYLADAYTLKAAEAEARIERILEGLDLFDGVEVAQRTAPGRATITIRLKTLPRLGE